MIVKNILSGFFVKLITGFDDTMVHIPIAGSVTRTRLGKIAFALGILIAITIIIIFSILFASAIKLIPYHREISATLVFLLALAIYFNVFVNKPKDKIQKKLQKKKIKGISYKRFIKLVGIGFIAAFATIIDDSIAYSALFLGGYLNTFYVVIGIYMATFLELFIIIRLSKFVSKTNN